MLATFKVSVTGYNLLTDRRHPLSGGSQSVFTLESPINTVGFAKEISTLLCHLPRREVDARECDQHEQGSQGESGAPEFHWVSLPRSDADTSRRMSFPSGAIGET
jgi:hypothetical protein